MRWKESIRSVRAVIFSRIFTTFDFDIFSCEMKIRKYRTVVRCNFTNFINFNFWQFLLIQLNFLYFPRKIQSSKHSLSNWRFCFSYFQKFGCTQLSGKCLGTGFSGLLGALTKVMLSRKCIPIRTNNTFQNKLKNWMHI